MARQRTLTEKKFDRQYMKKYNSLMAQGNGYLGLLWAHEEAWLIDRLEIKAVSIRQ